MKEHSERSLSPVLEQERLVIVDVLRGIALLGVVIANVWLWFSGLAFRFPAYREQLHHMSIDSAAFVAIFVFINGKAMSTFAFLFGLGFAIQMQRATARGRSIVRVYARRLTVLLVLGLAHMVLLWYGDILALYATLGFVLLLFRNRADRTLLIWAGVFTVVVPVLVGGVPWLLSAFGVALPQPDVAELTRRHAATLSLLQHASYADVVRENLRQAGQFYLGRKTLWMLTVLGLFLLGSLAGRHRVFERLEEHRRMFRSFVVWGMPLGLAGAVGIAVLQRMTEPDAMIKHPGLMFVLMVVATSSTLLMAAGYVGAAALLWQRPAFARRLAMFAPVGRMALTNYLCQTVIMLLLFYPFGGGWIGRTGPAAGLVIAISVFGVQLIWSRVWLTYFQFGPMEYLWRSFTYGARPRLRASSERSAAAVAGNAIY
jgi:uncharacterized protein